MNLIELFAALEARGSTLYLDGDTLRYGGKRLAPAGQDAACDEIRAAVKANKPAVIMALQAERWSEEALREAHDPFRGRQPAAGAAGELRQDLGGVEAPRLADAFEGMGRGCEGIEAGPGDAAPAQGGSAEGPAAGGGAVPDDVSGHVWEGHARASGERKWVKVGTYANYTQAWWSVVDALEQLHAVGHKDVEAKVCEVKT